MGFSGEHCNSDYNSFSGVKQLRLFFRCSSGRLDLFSFALRETFVLVPKLEH